MSVDTKAMAHKANNMGRGFGSGTTNETIFECAATANDTGMELN